jgi:uncharacterized membrane protein YedE/YeeE
VIQVAVAAVAGALFALGLILGGMTIPAKITGFLDVGGAWDPALAFVMIGAIAVYAPLLRLIKHRPRPIGAERFHWPTAKQIDARLIVGMALFGVGWGLSGYCPGPALASVTGGAPSAVVFVAFMILGTVVTRLALRSRA